ncbi:ceramidase [Cokeromyces recurvatus]|uniref:ceramidase n=1 Tax=Cokeromyces recurvatus TaxID=90255 RepID=UPI0022207DED|nr:ceramidase [Cokeromyces recurvatus]KAI7899544.1 ceramidase [Cokeromyces recurvatus]
MSSFSSSSQIGNFWGEVTSTIDWCEENYTISPYLAEFFNTITNLGFVIFSLFGIYNILKNGSNKTIILAYLGVIFVGFGSWCFHMTLQYKMQLLDELPMIYVASLVMWLTYLADPNTKNNIIPPLVLFIYSVIITYSYLIINNPIFHQVSYGILVVGIVIRATYLFYQIPQDKSTSYSRPRMRLLLWLSAFGFIIAFILWNIDNQFCMYLRAWRNTVPILIGSVSELHGWWHIGTALGVYYFIVFCEWIQPTLAKENKKFKLCWMGPLCYLRLIEKKRKD